jgi:hypothetical protein
MRNTINLTFGCSLYQVQARLILCLSITISIEEREKCFNFFVPQTKRDGIKFTSMCSASAIHAISCGWALNLIPIKDYYY